MKEINIAELIKDCPKGMELDCTMFDNVSFLRIQNGTNQIIICTPDGLRFLNSYGCYHDDNSAKCVIFPKGKTTWEGFVPPCKFKDGDIITCTNSACSFVAIFKKMITDTTFFRYVYLTLDDEQQLGIKYSRSDFKSPRFATGEETEKLFHAIKAKGYKWNAETKTLEKLIEPKFKVGDKIANDDYVVEITEIDSENEVYIYESKVGGIGCILFSEQDDWELVRNKFDINSLKPFDRVLVKYCNVTDWKAEIYSHYDEGMTNSPFCCIGAWYERCIPYEGNEHLLGTDEDCDEYYKTWK